jgi:hypothetical protein
MAEKIFLITDVELAEHTKEKQLELVAALQQIHAAYPDADGASLISYALQLASTQNAETEDWDYIKGAAFDPINNILPEVNEAEVEEWLHNEVVPVYENAITEDTVTEDEEQVDFVDYDVEAEETTSEETVDAPVQEHYEPQPLPPVPSETHVIENIIEDDEEEADEDEVVVEEPAKDEDHNQDEDYFANPTTVSRQRKWRGLLSEAGKLDR